MIPGLLVHNARVKPDVVDLHDLKRPGDLNRAVEAGSAHAKLAGDLIDYRDGQASWMAAKEITDCSLAAARLLPGRLGVLTDGFAKLLVSDHSACNLSLANVDSSDSHVKCSASSPFLQLSAASQIEPST